MSRRWTNRGFQAHKGSASGHKPNNSSQKFQDGRKPKRQG